jgi:DnaJ-class molecular chaperone
LIECPVCFGSGYDSDGSCHTCAGFGAVYFTEEK